MTSLPPLEDLPSEIDEEKNGKRRNVTDDSTRIDIPESVPEFATEAIDNSKPNTKSFDATTLFPALEDLPFENINEKSGKRRNVTEELVMPSDNSETGLLDLIDAMETFKCKT